MTKAQAARLQLKWKLRVPRLSCTHPSQECRAGTNILNCRICGEEL